MENMTHAMTDKWHIK